MGWSWLSSSGGMEEESESEKKGQNEERRRQRRGRGTRAAGGWSRDSGAWPVSEAHTALV